MHRFLLCHHTALPVNTKQQMQITQYVYIRHFVATNGLDIVPPDMPTVTEQMNDADAKLFYSILQNQNHAQQYFFADNPVYNLRPRKHNKTLTSKTAELSNRNFLLRMLKYRDWY